MEVCEDEINLVWANKEVFYFQSKWDWHSKEGKKSAWQLHNGEKGSVREWENEREREKKIEREKERGRERERAIDNEARIEKDWLTKR